MFKNLCLAEILVSVFSDIILTSEVLNFKNVGKNHRLRSSNDGIISVDIFPKLVLLTIFYSFS